MSIGRPKRRDIHPETGLWYWGLIKGRETWLTEEKFESYRLRVNSSANSRNRKIKEDSGFFDKPRPKAGSFDPDTGLYFLRMCGIQEKWVTKEVFDEQRKKRLLSERARKAANPEKYRAKYLEYMEKNKDRERERCRLKMAKYRSENKDDFKKKQLRKKNERCKERAKNDPVFAMKMRALFSLNRAFKQNGLSKPGTGSSHDLLGCTWEELKKHMESQFTNGMSWDNRGEWHVDHIIPLSTGKTIDEVKRLCHYSNLQPLWAVDNLKKGAKIL